MITGPEIRDLSFKLGEVDDGEQDVFRREQGTAAPPDLISSPVRDPDLDFESVRRAVKGLRFGEVRVIIADFHGRENNQAFWARKPQLFGDLTISAPISLIVYLAKTDSIRFKSTLAVPCIFR